MEEGPKMKDDFYYDKKKKKKKGGGRRGTVNSIKPRGKSNRPNC
jgi:hypothetical protein